MSTIPSSVRVLFFDVFGTCVQQRPPLADGLWKAVQEALKSDSSISSDIRDKATKMTYDQWFEFGGNWNKDINEFTEDMKAETGNVDWIAVDKYRLNSLCKLLYHLGLIILPSDTNFLDLEHKPRVERGSLFNDPTLKDLVKIWHRLPPWKDTCAGLEQLNTKFETVALSNTYKELMEGLVKHSSIPFKHVYTADMWNSYKPNPKVYLGAAEKMGVKPEECALVAAHLDDLKGAKACGFYAMYVERALEERHPDWRGDGIPDLTITEDEEGFISLAKKLVG